MLPKESGIYCFENILDNKKYIGQAQNIRNRVGKHKTNFKKDRDGCNALENAWNFYGEENFIIYVIELCDIGMLNDRETFWIKELHSHVSEHGYNISFGGDAFFRGQHHFEDSKRRISENSTILSGELNAGYGKPVPEERKFRISATLKKYYETHDAPGLGIKQSEATIQKRIGSLKGKKRKQEFIDKTANSKLGKKNKNSSSKYIGVFYNKRQKNWVVRFTFQKQKIYGGTFKTEIEAAIAYNLKAIELYGENARLNIIPEEKEV